MLPSPCLCLPPSPAPSPPSGSRTPRVLAQALRPAMLASLALATLLAGCGSDGEVEGPAGAGSPEAGSVASPGEGPGEAPEPVLDPRYAQEVETIAVHPRVAAALAYLEEIEPRSLEELVTLTEIPAPPFMEEERAAAYAEMLRVAGADSVWIDGIGNVIGLRRGTTGERTVAVDAHLDTVFPIETDVTVRFRGDTLYAPGVGDDTRGLIVVRNVLEAMVTQDLRTQADLLFIGTVGEEGLGDLRGVKYLFGDAGVGEEGLRIDAFIAVDGGDETRIVNQAVGSHRYRVTFQGPGGHSWGAFGLANPHNALAGAISRFVPEADAHTRQGPRTGYSIGRIGGGTSVNSIPFESWMEVDMRSLDAVSLQGLDDLFQAAVQAGLEAENALRRRGEPLEVEVEMVGNRPAGIQDPNETPLIQRAMAAIERQGNEPAVGSGSTNANTPISLGIPAITLGRGGRGGNAHALDEWWLPVDPHLAAQNALLVTLAEGGFGG
jgi:tripeptide aminopeptidase